MYILSLEKRKKIFEGLDKKFSLRKIAAISNAAVKTVMKYRDMRYQGLFEETSFTPKMQEISKLRNESFPRNTKASWIRYMLLNPI